MNLIIPDLSLIELPKFECIFYWLTLANRQKTFKNVSDTQCKVIFQYIYV